MDVDDVHFHHTEEVIAWLVLTATITAVLLMFLCFVPRWPWQRGPLAAATGWRTPSRRHADEQPSELELPLVHAAQ